MESLTRGMRRRAVSLLLALLSLGVLPNSVFAAKAGEACGRLDGWSQTCDRNLKCDIKPGAAIGLCVDAVRRCGGLLGAPCGDGEYCDYEIEAMCGAADQTGVCRTPPKACTFEYKPVCGCDDTTYPNACAANAQGVSVAKTGECSTCDQDADCPSGFCQRGVTCAGLNCPKPVNHCVTCGDGSQLTCKKLASPCPSGQVREIIDGCYGECVERGTCEPAEASTCEYGGKTYEVGDSFPATDGCNTCRCDASGTAQCTLKLCPSQCNESGKRYVSRDPGQCRAILFNCDGGTKPFFDACGCGCVRDAKPPVVTPPPTPRCVVGGCSGQMCVDAASGGGISTCEWREEYACYRGATCAAQANGRCGWTQTPQLRACLGR
ncbi:MAG: hypothetical protein ABW252_19530 [Polyangiales bacterium]